MAIHQYSSKSYTFKVSMTGERLHWPEWQVCSLYNAETAEVNTDQTVVGGENQTVWMNVYWANTTNQINIIVQCPHSSYNTYSSRSHAFWQYWCFAFHDPLFYIHAFGRRLYLKRLTLQESSDSFCILASVFFTIKSKNKQRVQKRIYGFRYEPISAWLCCSISGFWEETVLQFI